MTDETLDSGSPGGGTEGAPSPSGSAQGNDSGGSGQVALTKEQWDALQARLSDIERRTQSEKDRAVKRTNERIDKLEDGVRPLLERAAKEGKSVSDVLKDIDQQEEAEVRQALREMAHAFKSGTLPIPAGGNQAGGGSDAAKVFADKGLDPSDPEVQVALAQVAGKSPEVVELAAFRLKDRKATLPQPTGAQAAAINSEKPAKVNVDQLKAEYDKEVALLRGQPGAIADVKKKYRDKGLPGLW